MPIRKYKPTSPARRFQTVQVFDDITSTEPHKPLIEPLRKSGYGEYLLDVLAETEGR